eukprot:1906759-Prymnesium_polylepis.1
MCKSAVDSGVAVVGRACDQVMALMAARADAGMSNSDATEALAARDLRMAVPLLLQKSRFSGGHAETSWVMHHRL